MAYDEGIAQRIREKLEVGPDVVEKKMFGGGLAFMIEGNMCCGVSNERLMARVGAAQYDAALREPFAREMDFAGKPLKGFVYVAPEGFDSDEALDAWLQRCLDFVSTLPPK